MKKILFSFCVLVCCSCVIGVREETDLLLTSKLMKLYENETENYMISPWSVIMGLGIIYEGLGDNSRKQLEEVLGFEDTDRYRKRMMSLSNIPKESSVLTYGNLLIMDNSSAPLKSFVNNVRTLYGVSPFIQNFLTVKSSKLVNKVNQWVANNTNGRIDKFLPKNSVDKLTRLLTVNVLSFEDQWEQQFDQELTQPKPFMLESGKEIVVPTMNGDLNNIHAKIFERGDTVVALPFANDSDIMMIFVKTNNESALFDDLAQGTGIGSILFNVNETLPRHYVSISLPKFDYSTQKELKTELTKLGISDIFSDNADFSRLGKNPEGLKVSSIRHKTVVTANEEGVKAVAATGIQVTLYSLFIPDLTIEFNMPFFFFMAHQSEKSLLFAGKVENPTPGK